MVAYANFNQHCVDQALTEFMQYLPFIMLLQAVSIILIGNIQISWMDIMRIPTKVFMPMLYDIDI